MNASLVLQQVRDATGQLNTSLEAKAVAREEGTTLRALVAAGLRAELDRRSAGTHSGCLTRASPVLRLFTEAGDHWAHLRDVLEQASVTGARIHDARVVALCRSHGVRGRWTLDRDFSRFVGVRTVNPLASG